jgi:4-amino-4-deoxy-L-arabinose transferase-like glycosyltransferase
MPGTKSSRASRASEPQRRVPPAPTLLAVIALAAALASGAAWYCLQRGYTLYYGDAEAHLEIARRIVDSRTPGLEQFGTVWLPLPHALLLPLVDNGFLWQSGAAALYSGVPAYVLTVGAFYWAVFLLFGRTAALAGAALMALNPNLLYLQSTPMTEHLTMASVSGVLLCAALYWRHPGFLAAAGAGFFAMLGTLIRYDGWFLLPFVCAVPFLRAHRHRWWHAATVAAVAGAGPLLWLLHNLYFYSDPFEFYNSPYSAKGIYERGLKAGMAPAPGDGNLRQAAQYYFAAASLCAGKPLFAIGVFGAFAAMLGRAWWAVLLLLAPAVFYILSVYGSGTPIFVPELWPFSYYNTRYGLSALPLLALGGAALVTLVPRKARWAAAALVVGAASAPWLLNPSPEAVITWKESQVNSNARRAWTTAAAESMNARYKPGDGILISFGDAIGILREAGIPLREALHEGNGPEFLATVTRPDLFMNEEWAIAIAGDAVSAAMLKVTGPNGSYEQVSVIRVPMKDAPAIEIYRRRAPMSAPL